MKSLLALLLAFLVLAACSGAVAIGGDQSRVSVQFAPNFYFSAIEKAAVIAKRHCGVFDRTPVLLSTEYLGEDTSIAHFACR